MLPGFPGTQPVEGLVGGLLIGVAGAILLLGAGRIAGVSGLAARGVGLSDSGPARSFALLFLVGLAVGAIVVSVARGGIPATFPPHSWMLVVGGLLVGVGTRLGSGCTSGHGVCGISRLSRRSIIATLIFIGSGMATVALLNLAGAGW